MASPNETNVRIIDAAEALAARGERPTLAAVRRELGGGSFSTISEALKVWRVREAASTAGAAVTVPESVQAALAQAGAVVWAEATRQHAAQLAAEREALEAERARLEAEAHEATDLADQVSRDLAAIEGERDHHRAGLEAERAAHAETKAQAAAAQARVEERGIQLAGLGAALEAAQIAEAQARTEAEQVRGALDVARAETAAVQARTLAERAAAQQRIERAEAEAEAAKAQATEAGAALAVAREQIGRDALEIATLRGRLERAEQDGADAERRALEAERRADRADLAQHQAEQAAVSANQARDEAQADRAQAREDAARLGGQVEALSGQIAALLARSPAPLPAIDQAGAGIEAQGQPEPAPKRTRKPRV